MSALATALYGKLAADTTLTAMLSGGTASPAIFRDPAPQGATAPFVVFSFASEVDDYTLGGRAFEDAIYTVKAIDKAPSAARAGTIAARIDAVLTDGTLSVSGHTHLYTRRQSSIEYPEIDQGDRYWHSGGQFRIVVQ